jgi:hypothetical protein
MSERYGEYVVRRTPILERVLEDFRDWKRRGKQGGDAAIIEVLTEAELKLRKLAEECGVTHEEVRMELNEHERKLKAMYCKHEHISDIGYTDQLPSITGDNTRFYTGFCTDCQETVYCRTGDVKIGWNLDRNKTFGHDLDKDTQCPNPAAECMRKYGNNFCRGSAEQGCTKIA